ncbi:ribonuclease R [Bartonella ancashensis]|uniref:Ribonuclease R n=1 Tax=Bartonella ancashensis TaxID=1318743 RepID=A0A0M3T328_9HYPH|nr:3'-to-5' exoribonuclease RNase R [Bartonella ancashensis]
MLKQYKKLIPFLQLPSIVVVKISARNNDGSFTAQPINWNDSIKHDVKILPLHSKKDKNIGVEDYVLVKTFLNKNSQVPSYTGRIVRKIYKKKTTTVGIVKKLENDQWQFLPLEKKDRGFIVCKPLNNNIQSGHLIEAEIPKSTRSNSKNIIIKNILGHITDEKELAIISLISKEIPYHFPKNVLEQVENIKPSNTVNREDWRNLPFITIDPPDAKDHDDAVYTTKDKDPTNEGGWIIIVAIADVSYYVKTDSALDKEAFKRGNSIYFPGKVIPMLPEFISNNLCSLREGEDRPALAVRMIFDANGNKRQHSFHRITMRTIAKLSYQEVQYAIEGNVNEKTVSLLENILKPLWEAYDSLKIARNSRQPLELEISEKKIILDDQGRIKDIIIPPRLEAHRLIEEFMIQANVSAAETLKRHQQPFIYRIHDKPSLAKQETLYNFLHNFEIVLSKKEELTSKKLNSILINVSNTQKQELINQVILRSQSQAEYHPKNRGHFGLNLQNYTHFTSPIRRYADLIVHRALIKALQLGDDTLEDKQEQNLAQIAIQISSHERRAMIAERETVDRLIAHYLENKVGHIFTGRISGVTKAGLFILLDNLHTDGFVPISTLRKDHYHLNEEQHALVGKYSKKCYQIGDKVEIKLVEVQPISGSLCLKILTEPHPSSFSSSSYNEEKYPIKKKRSDFYQRKNIT